MIALKTNQKHGKRTARDFPYLLMSEPDKDDSFSAMFLYIWTKLEARFPNFITRFQQLMDELEDLVTSGGLRIIDGHFDFGNKQALQEGELIIEKMEDMDAEAEQWMWLFIKELQDNMGIGYEDD